MRGAVVAIGVALVLAACSDDPVPKEPDTTAAPTSSSASPATTPPPLPEEAKVHTASGAASFAIYWIDVSTFASVTGDTSELTQISDKKCQGCTTYVDLYEQVYEAGGHIEGSVQRLSEMSVSSPDPDVVIVRATHSMSEGIVLNSSESAEIKTKASTARVSFRAEWADDGWMMTGFAADE